ncbi:hypothetical protein ACFVVC_04445 [Pseudarthrobacter sp. NPDC058196]|uniref:hypothetical protein n=1 Tax=Pseudarthrobacter sp. NPDC058196 TaxID=3346376 RepID=UPI0036DA9322
MSSHLNEDDLLAEVLDLLGVQTMLHTASLNEQIAIEQAARPSADQTKGTTTTSSPATSPTSATVSTTTSTTNPQRPEGSRSVYTTQTRLGSFLVPYFLGQ